MHEGRGGGRRVDVELCVEGGTGGYGGGGRGEVDISGEGDGREGVRVDRCVRMCWGVLAMPDSLEEGGGGVKIIHMESYMWRMWLHVVGNDMRGRICG